jgi:hypothetical protein
MWESFWPDIVVAVVGAVIGSVLTVGIAVATYFITIRHRENQALNALVRELHERRAIAPIASPREIPGAAELDDYDRANRSVVSMRDEISRTRELVGQSPEVQLSLSEMKRTWNALVPHRNATGFSSTNCVVSYLREYVACRRFGKSCRVSSPAGARSESTNGRSPAIAISRARAICSRFWLDSIDVLPALCGETKSAGTGT